MPHIDIHSLIEGAVGYGALAFAARTIPIPDNPWARWLVGVIQFVLSNVEKGTEAINAPPALKEPK